MNKTEVLLLIYMGVELCFSLWQNTDWRYL